MWYHWRIHHDCKRFLDVNEEGACIFCRMNDELIHKGYEVVPYDMPGAYNPKDKNPNVILQSICSEPAVKPS